MNSKPLKRCYARTSTNPQWFPHWFIFFILCIWFLYSSILSKKRLNRTIKQYQTIDDLMNYEYLFKTQLNIIILKKKDKQNFIVYTIIRYLRYIRIVIHIMLIHRVCEYLRGLNIEAHDIEKNELKNLSQNNRFE